MLLKGSLSDLFLSRGLFVYLGTSMCLNQQLSSQFLNHGKVWLQSCKKIITESVPCLMTMPGILVKFCFILIS